MCAEGDVNSLVKFSSIVEIDVQCREQMAALYYEKIEDTLVKHAAIS